MGVAADRGTDYCNLATTIAQTESSAPREMEIALLYFIYTSLTTAMARKERLHGSSHESIHAWTLGYGYIIAWISPWIYLGIQEWTHPWIDALWIFPWIYPRIYNPWIHPWLYSWTHPSKIQSTDISLNPSRDIYTCIPICLELINMD